jgi:hypothetical protein
MLDAGHKTLFLSESTLTRLSDGRKPDLRIGDLRLQFITGYGKSSSLHVFV